MNKIITAAAVAVALAAGLYVTGHLPLPAGFGPHANASKTAAEPPPPAVSVVTPVMTTLNETVLITGTFVPRREILIAPEVEGLRIIEILAEEGDLVKKGQPLARLDQEVLKAKLAENEAARARSDAAIDQAESNILQAEARRDEARKSLDRAKPLLKSRTISESVYEQREAAAITTAAQLVAARDGLKLARAEKNQIEALRRELLWRISKTTVLAPASGLISRRTARIGSVASAVANAQPLFRLIEDGEIELDAEIPEADAVRIRIGQPATVTPPNGQVIAGKVRLVPSEIERSTRLATVRIALANATAQTQSILIGGFARGYITTATREVLAVPLSAVSFNADVPHIKTVVNDKVVTRPVEIGIKSGDLVEIKKGLGADAAVIAKAASFVRHGDIVRPVKQSTPRLSEVR